MRAGHDLRAQLLEAGVSPEVATLIVLDAEETGIAVKVIDAHRTILATQEFDEWSVWEIRMHQSFDDEMDAYTFGEASDAAHEARGKEPPIWKVVTFPNE